MLPERGSTSTGEIVNPGWWDPEATCGNKISIPDSTWAGYSQTWFRHLNRAAEGSDIQYSSLDFSGSDSCSPTGLNQHDITPLYIFLPYKAFPVQHLMHQMFKWGKTK